MARRLTLQQTLARLGGPDLLQQLQEYIQDVAESTRQTGQKASLALTIETSKAKDSALDDPIVVFKTRLVPKLATPKAHPTFLYVDEGGVYSDDPRQMPMPLAAVPTTDQVVDETGGGQAVAKEV
jgi:hypothetical protein